MACLVSYRIKIRGLLSPGVGSCCSEESCRGRLHALHSFPLLQLPWGWSWLGACGQWWKSVKCHWKAVWPKLSLSKGAFQRGQGRDIGTVVGTTFLCSSCSSSRPCASFCWKVYGTASGFLRFLSCITCKDILKIIEVFSQPLCCSSGFCC